MGRENLSNSQSQSVVCFPFPLWSVGEGATGALRVGKVAVQVLTILGENKRRSLVSHRISPCFLSQFAR